MEERDRGNNIQLETGISNTPLHLERPCTLWTKDILECHWV